MKKLFLLPVLTMFIFACSSSHHGPGSAGSGEIPLVAKITASMTSEYGSGTASFTLSYDATDRLTKIEGSMNESYREEGTTYNSNSSYVATISYSSSAITVNVEENEVETGGGETEAARYTETFVYTLTDGYATACEYTETEESEDYENTYSYNYTFGYSEGYLDYIQQPPYTSYDCSWSNNNLTAIDSNIYTYTSYDNMANIDIIALFDDSIYGIDWAKTLKLKGITSAKLMSAMLDYTFAYTIDSAGYPTRIVSTDTEDGIVSTYNMQYYNK